MLARFFIERPIFAWVVSIVIVLIGGAAAFKLPVAQYPDITPPTVQVTASYPGANAQVVADSVAAPIEQQVNGVERMLYMSSQCTNDGAYNLTVTFELGTDLNMAQVLVQNRVALAMAQLPDQVKLQGVNTKKKSPSILLAINLISPDGRYDDIYLSNYATIKIKDELLRIDGVGDINYLGQRDYSMRAWLDPQKMATRNITTDEVVTAVKNQNVQVAAGTIGQQPVPPGQKFQLTMSTLGRLKTEEEFGNIIVKTSQGGTTVPIPGAPIPLPANARKTAAQIVRLRDIARVELGAQQYDQTCRLDGGLSVGLAVFQLPGSNALNVAGMIKKKMEELSKKFPEGLQYKIVYDTTPFIEQSVHEVFKTLFEAVILVAIVVLFFLQDWKAMILPMIDVPVSLVGTFAVMAVLGFSLNNLTLFGMVLAIGIVVDDAIVVLENVERQLSYGLDPKSATIKAMSEITGPIMAITLVLCSVFLPSVFFPGITGQFFRQFALVIAAAMIISAINAMTLTPSRAVAIFSTEKLDEHGHPHREALPWWIFGIFGGLLLVWLGTDWLAARMGIVHHGSEATPSAAEATKLWVIRAALFIPGAIAGGLLGRMMIHPVNSVLGKIFRKFNAGFDWLTERYGRAVGRAARMSAMVLVIYVGLLALTGVSLSKAPKGFIPLQDQGYLLVNVQLPDSASVQRTMRIMSKIDAIALGAPHSDGTRKGGIPGVAHTMSVSGQSFLLNANAPYFGSCFVILEPFEDRKSRQKYDAVIADKLRALFAKEIEGAAIQVFRAPPIQGLGTAGGFKLQVEQIGYSDNDALQKQTDAIVEVAQDDPRLVGVFTMFRADTPQIYLDIDREKCESFSVDVQNVFNTLQVSMGGYYVNQFNLFGRTWQVNLLAEPQYRTRTSGLNQLKLRNKYEQVVPLASLFEAQSVGGPSMVMRYNMYASAPVVGNPAPGTSSGDIVTIMDGFAKEKGADYEWTEIMFMQLKEGNWTFVIFLLGSALVFLVLAAKYESWRLPMSVILVVPMCLLCAVVGMLITRLPIDIFVQIGFLVLVGMAAKNAILIVEFAKQLHDEGKPLMEATTEASRLRLRPIIMTSFAFILGVLPLVVSEGAGAEMRQSLGTAVFTGMIGVAAFGIFLTPVFFYVMMWLSERKKRAAQGERVA